jgi:hypothetical protein
MKSNIPVIITALLVLIGSSHGQTTYEKELNQLIEQRDKAIAAAVAPINARFQNLAEQLLQRATKGGDLDAANKIKASLEITNTKKPDEAIKDLQKQVAGTAWKCVEGMTPRPGLEKVITFTDKTVEPMGYKYEVTRFNTLIITFNAGGTQVATLVNKGTQLLMPLGGKEYTYELVPK